MRSYRFALVVAFVVALVAVAGVADRAVAQTTSTAAPAIVSAQSPKSTQVKLGFSVALDATTASTASKYSLTAGASSIAVTAAQLQPDGVTVLLTTARQPPGPLTVAENGVASAQGAAGSSSYAYTFSEVVTVDNAQTTGTPTPFAIASGTWGTATDSGPYAGSYRYIASSLKAGLGRATFTPALAEAGTFEVFAWWTTGAAPSNRATNASFQVVTSSGAIAALSVSQTTNGAQWVSLGKYSLSPANAKVSVSNSNASGYVVADAVQFVYRGP